MIITRGFGDNQTIITRGYGVYVVVIIPTGGRRRVLVPIEWPLPIRRREVVICVVGAMERRQESTLAEVLAFQRILSRAHAIVVIAATATEVIKVAVKTIRIRKRVVEHGAVELAGSKLSEMLVREVEVKSSVSEITRSSKVEITKDGYSKTR